MPTLSIPAQTVQPGAHTGAWQTVPNGVTTLVVTVDLTAFTDPATVFGVRIEWRAGIGADPQTLVQGYVMGDPAGIGQWGMTFSRGRPTQTAVQARWVAAVGSLDGNGNPQLSGGNPVTIGASSVVVS